MPCADPLLPREEREAIREAGRWGLADADELGRITPTGREAAAYRVDEMVPTDPRGPYRLAAAKLRLGEAAALQCIRNHVLHGCPFRCLNQRPIGTLDD